MTSDLDLWPTDLNINRDHLLLKDYLPTKFEAPGRKRSWVISCTRLRETDIPTDRRTDRPTDMCKAICPSFFEEGHNDTKVNDCLTLIAIVIPFFKYRFWLDGFGGIGVSQTHYILMTSHFLISCIWLWFMNKFTFVIESDESQNRLIRPKFRLWYRSAPGQLIIIIISTWPAVYGRNIH